MATMMRLFQLLLSVLGTAVRLVEQLLFVSVQCYDKYIYSRLQSGLWPIIEKIPRHVKIDGKTHTIFSANIVSWARTVLVIPVAYCLKYKLCVSAFFLIIFHDFLDHLDGVVARVHRKLYGQVDDPLLGGFMDAFCDKIVSILALWSIVIVTDFSLMSWLQSTILLSACGIIIAYEFILGVVRVQDYFHAYYLREYKKSDHGQSLPKIEAVMEGKLKENLESMGIACLCLAQASPVLMSSMSGIIGVVCLVLAPRLAHASLMHKLSARTENIRPSSIKKISTILQEANSREKGEDEQNEDHGWRSTGTQVDINTTLKSKQNLTDQIMKKSVTVKDLLNHSISIELFADVRLHLGRAPLIQLLMTC